MLKSHVFSLTGLFQFDLEGPPGTADINIAHTETKLGGCTCIPDLIEEGLEVGRLRLEAARKLFLYETARTVSRLKLDPAQSMGLIKEMLQEMQEEFPAEIISYCHKKDSEAKLKQHFSWEME